MKQRTSSFRQLLAKCLAPLPVLLALPTLGYSATAAATFTSTEQLIGATEAFLEQATTEYLQRSEIQGRHEIRVNRLDPRLRLPLCDQPLTTTLESPAQPLGRVTTRVRCDGSAPWTVFVPAEVRLYERLFKVENTASEEGDFKDYINEDSLKVISNAWIEPSVQLATLDQRYQFLRKGYFCLDKTATAEKLVFNRTVTLKDAWSKEVKKG
jgi:hypothetical protein